jgi:hypothetical protein
MISMRQATNSPHSHFSLAVFSLPFITHLSNAPVAREAAGILTELGVFA